HVVPVEFLDHVARLEIGGSSRRIGHDLIDDDAFGLRGAWRKSTRLDAEVAVDDAALFEQTFESGMHGIRRNGKADPLIAAAPGIDRRVDADDLALEVDQRAAAVSWVDGGVRLEVIAEAVAAIRAACRADDSVGDGFL